MIKTNNKIKLESCDKIPETPTRNPQLQSIKIVRQSPKQKQDKLVNLLQSIFHLIFVFFDTHQKRYQPHIHPSSSTHPTLPPLYFSSFSSTISFSKQPHPFPLPFPSLPSSMKRPLISPPDDIKMKKIKHQECENESEPEVLEPGSDSGTGFVSLDENLLYEVMKHVDAKTLGRAACVSKQWHRTAQDERLWELICTNHWANFGCGTQQLRSVVLALGGFRRLHSQYLWPLSKPNSNSNASSSSWAPFPAMIGSKQPARRWGKDEVHLSLSLLSIRYYEKMNFSNRGR